MFICLENFEVRRSKMSSVKQHWAFRHHVWAGTRWDLHTHVDRPGCSNFYPARYNFLAAFTKLPAATLRQLTHQKTGGPEGPPWRSQVHTHDRALGRMQTIHGPAGAAFAKGRTFALSLRLSKAFSCLKLCSCPSSSCEIMSKLLSLSRPHHLHLRMGENIGIGS